MVEVARGPFRTARSLLALGLALFLAAIVVRLPGLGRSLFYDELFTAKTFVDSLPHALLTQKQANNHPLCSVLAWVSTQLLGRDDALALRAPSVLVGALAVVATAWLAGRRSSPVVAAVAGLLALVHPAHVGFSQEVRGYALLLLFAPLAVRLALDVLEGERRAVGVLAVSVAFGVWAHATFGVLALGLAAYLFFCKGVDSRDRRQALAGVVGGALLGVLLLAPTLSHLGKFAESNVGLTGESGGVPTLARLGAVAEMLSVGDARLGAVWPLGLALGTLALLGFAAKNRDARGGSRPSVEGAIGWILATTALVWLAARPLFYARFFAFLLPLVIVLAARGAAVLAGRLTALVPEREDDVGTAKTPRSPRKPFLAPLASWRFASLFRASDGGKKEKRTLVLFCAAPLVVGWALATGERAGWETQPTSAARELAERRAGPFVTWLGPGGDLLWRPWPYHVPRPPLLSVEEFLRTQTLAYVETFPDRVDDPTRAQLTKVRESMDELYVEEFPGLYSSVRVHIFGPKHRGH